MKALLAAELEHMARAEAAEAAALAARDGDDNMGDALARIYRHEGGWRALFRGSGARVAFHAPQIGITMALFERCKAFFSRPSAASE